MTFFRDQAEILRRRLLEPPRFIHIVAGPRQVGKTTLVSQATEKYENIFISTDSMEHSSPPGTIPREDIEEVTDSTGIPRDANWLIRQWTRARKKFRAFSSHHAGSPFIFVVDEIQKIPRWSEVVKGLWDEDRRQNLDMQVVLLGSSPLLIQKGMTESLAGRYELIRTNHWSYPEMYQAFGLTLDEYIYFGGYPGSVSFIRDDPERWRNYILSSLVQPSIDTDILQMSRVDKPALLKQTFELGASYSGQILALKTMKGQLDNAGNETTLADYLNLLNTAGLLRGLHQYHVGEARRRASPPKLNVLNTALMSSAVPYTFPQAQADKTFWGRLVETAVGAHLCNTMSNNETVSYWRASPHEVDFVVSNAIKCLAIEVKSGLGGNLKGLDAFMKKHRGSRKLVVGTEGVSLSEFLSYPCSHWLNAD